MQYLKQEGIYKVVHDSFDRLTVRANTSVNMTDNVVMFVDTFVGRDTQVTPDSNIYSLVYSMPANIVAKYPRKEGFTTDYYGYYIASYMNAYAQAERGQIDTHIRDYVTINARPQWTIADGLVLKGQVGYRLSTGMDKTNRDPYVFFNYFTGDEVVSFSMVKGATYTTRSNYWSASANLDWVKEIGGHRINLLGGWQSELNATTGWDKIALVSWYGKAYYSYKDRYLFEAGIRTDGSSLFTGKYKWGYFPSVAAGWNIDKEEFFKNVNWIDAWKVRTSFGMLGNNNVSTYSYQSLINSSGTETKNGNPDLRWETVSILDAGMDLSFLGYALDVNLDYYYKITDDLIMSLPSTLSSGLLNTPELSILEAKKEISNFAMRCHRMFGLVNDLLTVSKDEEFNKLFSRIEKYENITDNMENEIANYLTKVSEGHLSDESKARITRMMRQIDELESIGDSCYNLARTINRRRKNAKQEYTPEQTEHINAMMVLVENAMENMETMINHPDTQGGHFLKARNIENEINNFRSHLKGKNFEDVNAGKYPYQLGVYYIDYISECEKLADYIMNVNQASNECAKNK